MTEDDKKFCEAVYKQIDEAQTEMIKDMVTNSSQSYYVLNPVPYHIYPAWAAIMNEDQTWILERSEGKEEKKDVECECGKEKHGFASHSTWCPKEASSGPTS